MCSTPLKGFESFKFGMNVGQDLKIPIWKKIDNRIFFRLGN